MADKVDKATRSRIMAKVRSKDTKPEMEVRRALRSAGYGYRLHRKGLPGRPDIVLGKYRTAVFVHGCFWHGHGCRELVLPTSNAEYWSRKIERNKERDRAAEAALREAGWDVFMIWTCELAQGITALLERLSLKRAAINDLLP